ncbi:hypothetical protein HK103_003708 [Boothiomyces macroporosus]|uniref:Exonuclease domain-containing protein n=1 Tax=Boothiomyces macroporosus TaxID=261099 RepID=A0AAD5Y005_9FUNG|nr:hypothetical protein HK103_003708 [Boothiomyces macroporosus]
MIHENVIDTAQVFPHPKGLPYRHSLKMLVERNLGRFIQTGEHDSFEDARACIDLLKRHIHLSKK